MIWNGDGFASFARFNIHKEHSRSLTDWAREIDGIVDIPGRRSPNVSSVQIEVATTRRKRRVSREVSIEFHDDGEGDEKRWISYQRL